MEQGRLFQHFSTTNGERRKRLQMTNTPAYLLQKEHIFRAWSLGAKNLIDRGN
jgi:hypothetical protein